MEFITKEEVRSITGVVEDSQLALIHDLLNEVMSRVLNKAVETAMQLTPELTANLIKTSVGIRKLTSKFLEDNPEFNKHQDLVKKVVRDVEVKNPGMPYEGVLSISVPEIKKQLAIIGG